MKQFLGAVMSCLIVTSVGYGQEFGSKNCQHYRDYIQEYKSAVLSGRYLPQSLVKSEEEAYLMQACLIRSDSKKIIGFKAGLTSNASQKRFNVGEPVFGVITEESQHTSNELLVEDNKTMLIEAELAFRLGRDIYTLKDIDKVASELVDAVAPVIEMPLFHFKDLGTLTGNDIIATNVGVNKFLLGEFVSIDKVYVNSVHVSLNEGGQEIDSSVDKVKINQWQLLKWLIMKSYLEGYRLRKGMIYLTGSLVNPARMKKARYIADYSQFDSIELIAK
ncbi:MAG: hypothetical protein R8G33_10075 [Gammaproteobacteria bacterium]|nr:hypothetical protein [Gammaproteobacteria bacterium]